MPIDGKDKIGAPHIDARDILDFMLMSSLELVKKYS
jgi:hypothetical protein